MTYRGGMRVRAQSGTTSTLTFAVAATAALGLIFSLMTLPANAQPNLSIAPAATPTLDDRLGPQVVHGRPGTANEFGWLVAVGDRNEYLLRGLFESHICGGTLVSPTQVITAAHCVVTSGMTMSPARLIVGRTSTGKLTDPQAQVVRVSSIKVNPGYNERSTSGDLAVLNLATPITDATVLLPALPSEDSVLTVGGTDAEVAGWGSTRSAGTGPYPDAFRVGELVVFPQGSCGGARDYTVQDITFLGYGRGEANARTMICANGVRNSLIVDSCIGDSGGPLVAGSGVNRRLIGVVSWGPRRCASRYPGVYARVGAFTEFLRSAGVSFAAPPDDAPQAPSITSTSVTSTSATVTMRPSAEGITAQRYFVLARNKKGDELSCRVRAPQERNNARCTITGLTTGTRYTLRAYAVRGTSVSASSDPQVVQPAGAPRRPRIVYAEVTTGGVAVFGIDRISGNGSPLTTRIVSCTATNRNTRQGAIEGRGIATVTRLRRGSVYQCTARVTNAFGTAVSVPVSLRAR